MLTKSGWLPFSVLDGSERLATVNLDTDTMEYQLPDALIAKRRRGGMIRLGNGRTMDFLVTPKHRMVIDENRWKKPKVVLARDLKEHHGLKVSAANWKGKNVKRVKVGEDSVDAGDLAEFLGWYVAEGSRHLYHARTQRNAPRWKVHVAQSKPHTRKRLERLCSRLPWSFYGIDNGLVFTRRDLYEYVGICGDYAENKVVPSWIRHASRTIISRFLDGYLAGDGWKVAPGTSWEANSAATVSERLADDIQELFLKNPNTCLLYTSPSPRDS